MESNIQIREVRVSYQPQKGTLFQIKNSQSAYDYISRVYDESTIGLYEEFMVLLLNRANRVLGCLKLSRGGLTGTVVDLRILYGTALKAMASGIIIAHNPTHISLKPNREEQQNRRVDNQKLDPFGI